MGELTKSIQECENDAAFLSDKWPEASEIIQNIGDILREADKIMS